MIKIDFHGSTHGHFLEFISNVFVMQTSPGNSELFNSLGAAHNTDNQYKSNRLIKCGHFSRSNYKFKEDEKVIRITIDKQSDMWFYIAFINLMFRAGDVGIEKQLICVDEKVRSSNVLLRNDFYAKFSEREKYVNEYSDFAKITGPVFEFPFESFYFFDKFCIALNELARFLEQTFFIDAELTELWRKFMSMNQGWKSYVKCADIIEKILSNTDYTIDCSVIEQAWINYNLSKMCRIYSGPMFDNEVYPINCKDIYAEIQQQLAQLR